MDDFRHYSVVTKSTKTQRTDFGSVKPGERKILDGPFEWAGVKSKYFFIAALAVEDNQPRFGGALVEGGPRTASASSLFGRSAVATRAAVAVTLPVPPAGGFDYQCTSGPSSIGGCRTSATIWTMPIRTAGSCSPSSSPSRCWS